MKAEAVKPRPQTSLLRRAVLTLTLSTGLLAGADAAHAADVTVHIRNIQSQEGQLLLGLFENDEHWPEGPGKHQAASSVRVQVIKPKPGEVVAVFRDVKPGRYALSVHHDENGDGRFNRMLFPFMGMPTEPYAFSKDVWFLVGAASFERSAFEVAETAVDVPLWLSTHLQKIGGNSGAPNTSADKASGQ